MTSHGDVSQMIFACVFQKCFATRILLFSENCFGWDHDFRDWARRVVQQAVHEDALLVGQDAVLVSFAEYLNQAVSAE